MSKWIKVTDMLPGNNRPIQIWGAYLDPDPVYPGVEKWFNYSGYYNGANFYNSCDVRIGKVTHWAEMLPAPEKEEDK